MGVAMKHRILVIDDEPRDLEAIKIFLEPHGYSVKTTTDVDEGIAYVRQNRGKLSLAMVDFNMPAAKTDGAKIAKVLSEIDPELQIATYSGENSETAFETTMAAGSRYFIQKGIEPRKTLAIVKTLCARFEEAHKTLILPPVTAPELEQLHAIGFAGTSRHLVEVGENFREGQ
jgi:DNA-binding NtrC family response regulator